MYTLEGGGGRNTSRVEQAWEGEEMVRSWRSWSVEGVDVVDVVILNCI